MILFSAEYTELALMFLFAAFLGRTEARNLERLKNEANRRMYICKYGVLCLI